MKLLVIYYLAVCLLEKVNNELFSCCHGKQPIASKILLVVVNSVGNNRLYDVYVVAWWLTKEVFR
jgi:hypothetical protein